MNFQYFSLKALCEISEALSTTFRVTVSNPMYTETLVMFVYCSLNSIDFSWFL